MDCGARTSGSTVPPWGVTRRVSGGTVTTSTASVETSYEHAHARRWNDVDDVDADARTNVAGRRGVLHGHVGRNDGSDDAAGVDADVVAVSPDRGGDERRVDRRGARKRWEDRLWEDRLWEDRLWEGMR